MTTTENIFVQDSRRRMMMEKSDIIITKESNPKLLAILYSKGYCKHENFMTRKEAMGVTSLKRLLYNVSSSAACPRSFDEMRFFTGLTNKADSTAQLANWAQYLREMTFPPHLTALGNPVMGRANTAPRVIIGGKVTDTGDYFFYGCANKSLPRICICKAIVPPTIKTDNSHPEYIDLLYVPDESVTAYSEDSLWGQAQSILPISQCPREYGEYKGLIKGNALDE